jgi:assimilatory nitrate reductase catalytic subunit
MAAIRTTCPYCGVGCGVSATVTGERSVEIKGDTAHPANRGGLCSKGTHLGETVSLEGRLLHPMIGDARASWGDALDLVAKRFADTIAEHGPESVAFYVSGQILTEDYYVANKLMKGFIGTANIDTNSRLCMASAVAGHIRAFGEDVVPATYDDLDEADLIVLVGSNTAWCHPIVWQRIEAARERRGTRLVVIDPRRTETAEGADFHLAIRPGSDVALFNGLLAHCRRDGIVDEAWMADHVAVPENFWDDLDAGGDLWTVARECDVPVVELARFYELFARHHRTVTLFSQGVNQSVQGVDKVNAILNVHLATGRIGKPGAAPFSITGQPNAMGGREVGGLASTLAAHMGFTDAERDRVQRFWDSPAIAPAPGLKAVDMFRAVGEGRIKALWIMATNPAVSLPDAGAVRNALANCPFVVVSDCIAETDTIAFAHVRLPASAWAEKEGTVTNSERRISRQRRIFADPGEARPDWWAITQVARRMGWADAFPYESAADVYREYAAMTAFENGGARVLDIGHQAAIADEDYEAMEPFLWGGTPFADGRFPAPGGRARMIAVKPATAAPADPQWPLTLNTGRYRDQWHTMTRTGLSPRLSRHRQEPLVEIHPEDAERLGIAEGDLGRVITAHGESIFRAHLTDAQRVGELFVPIHWTDQQSTGGRTGRLPLPTVDPISGQPGFKMTPARIERVSVEWTGFLVCAEAPDTPDAVYSTRIRTGAGWLMELAGDGDPARLLEGLLPAGERIEVSDSARGQMRVAVLAEGRLKAALFTSRTGALPSREWLVGQLEAQQAPSPPAALLAGRPAKPMADRGPIVCVCFDIGMTTILSTIASDSLTSVEQVGASLGAGTNCGSCRPAIAKLLRPTAEMIQAG